MPRVRTAMSVSLQPLDRSLANAGIVCWQSPRTRRAGARAGPIAIVIVVVVCAIAGGAMVAGHALGVLHSPRLLAFLPAALVVAAVATRAGRRWLAG
jgi:hypothetical protein